MPYNARTLKGEGELSDRGDRGNLPMVCDEAQSIAKHLKDRRVIRIAQARRGLDQRIKYPLQIEGRPADDLKHVGSRRLLLEALGEFLRAQLHLLEQTRVLDSDNGLVGEGFQKFDLTIGEMPHLCACDSNGSDGLPVFAHRHGHCATEPFRYRDLRLGVIWISKDIRNFLDGVSEDRASSRESSSWQTRASSP